MQIQGSTFIVTGGASGLGEGTVRMLAAAGAHVVIAAAPPMLGLLRQHVYLPRQPAVLEWPHNLAALPSHELDQRLREVCLEH